METPTYEEVSEMAKAAVLGLDTPLSVEYPETWATLLDEIDEIEADGYVVYGYDAS